MLLFRLWVFRLISVYASGFLPLHLSESNLPNTLWVRVCSLLWMITFYKAQRGRKLFYNVVWGSVIEDITNTLEGLLCCFCRFALFWEYFPLYLFNFWQIPFVKPWKQHLDGKINSLHNEKTADFWFTEPIWFHGGWENIWKTICCRAKD